MKGIQQIEIKVRKTDNTGIFHDTRGDVERLGEVCNILIDKVNELVEKLNELTKEE